MSKTTHSIFIRTESAASSWMRDASSFALFAALIGVGIYMESAAMQWAGCVIAFFVLTGKAFHMTKSMTISEAREYLDKLEATQDD